MSSLIFYTDEKQALVATDTLVVNADDKLPKNFSSKAFFIPHINTIVAGTGLAGFADQWLACINSNLLVADIDELASHSQSLLSEAFQRCNRQFPDSNNFTTTIYHFGFPRNSNEMKTYAHRSTNDFEPEILQYGTGTKPECVLPECNYNLVDIIPDLMNKQREEQQNLPENKRVYIGGEIYAMHLTASGCNTFKIREFDTYSSDKEKVYKKL